MLWCDVELIIAYKQPPRLPFRIFGNLLDQQVIHRRLGKVIRTGEIFAKFFERDVVEHDIHVVVALGDAFQQPIDTPPPTFQGLSIGMVQQVVHQQRFGITRFTVCERIDHHHEFVRFEVVECWY